VKVILQVLHPHHICITCASSKDLKLTDALRNAKARVDTHWKKQALGTTTNGNTAAPPKANEGGVAAFLRSNSVRNRVPTKTTVEPTKSKYTKVYQQKTILKFVQHLKYNLLNLKRYTPIYQQTKNIRKFINI